MLDEYRSVHSDWNNSRANKTPGPLPKPPTETLIHHPSHRIHHYHANTMPVPPNPDDSEHIEPSAATTYWKLTALYGKSYYPALAQQIIDHDPTGPYLDVGTGPGYLPILVATQLQLPVHATDATARFTHIGRSLARATGVPVHFWTSDINNLPTTPNTYELITCTGVLHGLTNPVAAINELHRTLTSTGQAWVFDPALLDYESDIEHHLTPHERTVWHDHLESRDTGLPETYTTKEATDILTATQFTDYKVTHGDAGDLRLILTK